MNWRAHPRLFGAIWFIFILLLVAFSISVAYFVTGFLYSFFGLSLPALAVQIVNTFLGLFLTGVTISFFSRFFKAQRFNAFQPIIQALERIATGDFSIRLEDAGLESNEIMGGLVTTVNKMALELGQMESMRQEFVSNVSHEIQSPLTSIRGFARALEDDALSPEERHHYLSIIETESTRLSRLADDLLKLASLEADQVKFEFKSYRLDRQIRSLILTCEPQWREKNIALDVALDEVSITADQDLLNQVWLNLLHNGIKFTGQDGSIRVALALVDGRAEVRIADSGVGISPEERIHIFERFYKADKSRTSATGGSGLGLSIVKKIIDIHGGDIRVESEIGQGATFIVSLPKER